MSLLVLLLVVVLEKFSSWRLRVQNDGPWLSWLARIQGRANLQARPWLGLVLVVVLPTLLLALVLWALGAIAYGWLLLPIDVLVLLYGLGRRDVMAALGPFRDAWRRGDRQGALYAAERDLAIPADEASLEAVQARLVWEAYQGFFSVIFWYALLGPVPVLLYRLLALTVEHAGNEALRARAQQLRHGMDWLPARLLVFSFALVGNFAAVSASQLQEMLHWELPVPRLLGSSAYAAADLARVPADEGVQSLDALWQLLLRSAVLWYSAFAVVLLFF